MIHVPARIRRALALPLLICLLTSPCAAGQADHQSDPAADLAGNYPAEPQGPVLHSATLDDVLHELDLPDAEALTLLDRLILWLDEYFRDRGDEPLPDWLNEFRISDLLATSIFYAACALIVGLSIAIIANEARHFRRRPSRTRPSSAGFAIPPGNAAATVLEDLPLLERPAHLLEVILGRLPASEYTRRPLSLTHREILELSHGLSPEQREPFTRLTRVAEQIRYSDTSPPSDDVGEAVQSARSLLPDEGS